MDDSKNYSSFETWLITNPRLPSGAAVSTLQEFKALTIDEQDALLDTAKKGARFRPAINRLEDRLGTPRELLPPGVRYLRMYEDGRLLHLDMPWYQEVTTAPSAGQSPAMLQKGDTYRHRKFREHLASGKATLGTQQVTTLEAFWKLPLADQNMIVDAACREAGLHSFTRQSINRVERRPNAYQLEGGSGLSRLPHDGDTRVRRKRPDPTHWQHVQALEQLGLPGARPLRDNRNDRGHYRAFTVFLETGPRAAPDVEPIGTLEEFWALPLVEQNLVLSSAPRGGHFRQSINRIEQRTPGRQLQADHSRFEPGLREHKQRLAAVSAVSAVQKLSMRDIRCYGAFLAYLESGESATQGGPSITRLIQFHALTLDDQNALVDASPDPDHYRDAINRVEQRPQARMLQRPSGPSAQSFVPPFMRGSPTAPTAVAVGSEDSDESMAVESEDSEAAAADSDEEMDDLYG